MKNPKVIELGQVLKEWVNEVLARDRIIVKDLRDDMYDGQVQGWNALFFYHLTNLISTVFTPKLVLQKLFERLTNKDLKLSDIRQAELEQKKKLNKVLEEVNDYLQLDIAGGTTKWSVDSIHSKNYVAILHLLVALAIKSHADIRNGFLFLLFLSERPQVTGAGRLRSVTSKAAVRHSMHRDWP